MICHGVTCFALDVRSTLALRRLCNDVQMRTILHKDVQRERERHRLVPSSSRTCFSADPSGLCPSLARATKRTKRCNATKKESLYIHYANFQEKEDCPVSSCKRAPNNTNERKSTNDAYMFLKWSDVERAGSLSCVTSIFGILL